MTRRRLPEELGDILETLVEGQTALASTLYLDLVNTGLITADAAAERLRGLAKVMGSPLQRDPNVAALLHDRLNQYADALAHSPRSDIPRVKLSLIRGGRN